MGRVLVTRWLPDGGLDPLAGHEIAAKAPASGLSWHFCRPPVLGLDFEMDVRRPALESLL